MIGRAVIASLLMIEAACTTVPAEEEQVRVHGETGRRCVEGRAQHLVGRPASSDLAQAAQRLTGAGVVRWIGPGDLVTMDYREDRLNIELDERQRVNGFRCG